MKQPTKQKRFQEEKTESAKWMSFSLSSRYGEHSVFEQIIIEKSLQNSEPPDLPSKTHVQVKELDHT